MKGYSEICVEPLRLPGDGWKTLDLCCAVGTNTACLERLLERHASAGQAEDRFGEQDLPRHHRLMVPQRFWRTHRLRNQLRGRVSLIRCCANVTVGMTPGAPSALALCVPRRGIG